MLFIAIVANSCVDEIDLNVDNNKSSIVVDGRITDSLEMQTINIRTSAVIGVGNDNVLPPITGATVNVIDSDGASFSFVETSDGVYQKEMSGVTGKSYSVDITLPDGKKIKSRPGEIIASPPVGNLRTEVFEVGNNTGVGGPQILVGIRLFADLDLSQTSERPLLRWQVAGKYEFREAYPMAMVTKRCYIDNKLDLNLIKIFDTNTLDNGVLRDERVVVTEYDYRFANWFCFKVAQYSITEEEYTYWSQIDDIVNIDGNFFDPPPGTVQGNLFNPDDPKDKILGYFSTSGVAFKRLFANPETTGVFVEERCSFSPFQPQYDECRACEEIIGSSIERPDYWPF